jgi:GDPmannose 4,6-dehydratase
MFACNGILFNHESPRRGSDFVTRKITQGVASITAGKQQEITLGNLDVKRDWGYSPEYIQIMWAMLQLDKPEDFVIGTGESHSIQEFVETAFEYVDLNWENYISCNKNLFRPSEVNDVIADTRKATHLLGWKPKITFYDLIKIMVDADMRKAGLESIGDGDELLIKHFPDKWWLLD